jgi:2-methylcitrate dehydratase PrpD
MDDVNWRVLTHPGSIIWPIATSIGIERGLTLKQVYEAAAYGYRTGATIANFFGPLHRSKWHVTSTSGAFAATTTAAIALGLSKKQHLKALHICAMNIGGSSQAVFERKGAAQTNRASAISLGATSAHSALVGAPHAEEIWSGPRGLFELFLVEGATSELLNGIDNVAIRLMDANGFVHSALAAALKLRQVHQEKIESITVVLSTSVASILDASQGGPWWNPAYAVAALWESGDPTNLGSASDFLSVTYVEFEEMPIGAGKVRIKTASGEHEEYVELAPEEITWRDVKWGKAGIGSAEDAYRRCSSFPLAALR